MAMRRLHGVVFMTLLTLAVLAQSKPHTATQVLYQKLEDALIADPNLKYLIKLAFFSSQTLSQDLVFLNVCVTVGGVQRGSCDNSSLPGGQSNFTHCQKFQWSSSTLVDFISFDQLVVIDNVISEGIFENTVHRKYLDFPIKIDALPICPTKDDILAALMQLLPWVKSYARNHGEPNENDKGYVSISYGRYERKLYYKKSDIYSHAYRLSLLCAFIFLNILTPVALAKSVSLYYPKIVAKSSTGDFIGCLYWATAVVTFLCNTLYTALSIRDYFFHGKTAITTCLIHRSCLIPSDTYIYNDEVITFIATLIVIPIAVFIELLLSIYVVKCQFNGQRNSHFWKHCLFQTVHVFALWNILVTLQLFTKVVIPVCVLLLIHPQVTVLYIAFPLMVPACIIFIVAYLLYHCQQPRRKICCKKTNCRLKSVQLLVIIVILGLIMTLLISYELLLMMQVEVGTGIKGLLLSLLPSFPLSALGWYLKRRSQKKAEQTPNGKTQQLMIQQLQCMPNCEDENIVPV